VGHEFIWSHFPDMLNVKQVLHHHNQLVIKGIIYNFQL